MKGPDMKIKLPKLPDPRTRDGVKTITRFFVARATSFTIVAIIRNNTDPDNPLETAGVFVGAHVLGEIVADATHEYVDKQIDEYADAFSAIKAARAESEIEIEIQN